MIDYLQNTNPKKVKHVSHFRRIDFKQRITNVMVLLRIAGVCLVLHLYGVWKLALTSEAIAHVSNSVFNYGSVPDF